MLVAAVSKALIFLLVHTRARNGVWRTGRRDWTEQGQCLSDPEDIGARLLSGGRPRRSLLSGAGDVRVAYLTQAHSELIRLAHPHLESLARTTGKPRRLGWKSAEGDGCGAFLRHTRPSRTFPWGWP